MKEIRLPTHPFNTVRSAVIIFVVVVTKGSIYLIITIEWRNNCIREIFVFIIWNYYTECYCIFL